MNRFRTKNDGGRLLLPFHIRIIYFICPIILLIFMQGLSSISASTISKQQESLENAINRDIIHCYAVEGFYPPSLAYLEDHYGLTYDKELFFVDYQPVASNLRPNVTILLKQ